MAMPGKESQVIQFKSSEDEEVAQDADSALKSRRD